VLLQLLMVGPHLPAAQVVVIGSSVHALHWPLVVLQPNWQTVPEPHCPSEPQVSLFCPLQRWVVGGQMPPHFPVFGSQMLGQVVGAPKLPVASQCLETDAAQESVPGMHSPAHRPVAALQVNVQAAA
jgi:hypothetical protein